MSQYNEYVADGSTRLFLFRFAVFDRSDLQVSLDGIPQTAGWLPFGLGSGNGGAIEFATAPSTGAMIRITRIEIPPQVPFLLRDENLADIQDKPLARTNLGVYSTAQTDTAIASAVDPVAASALQKAANLSDLTDAAQARTNLGVAIGSDIQAHDADLDWLSANLTAAGKALLDDADAAAQRATLNAAASNHSHASTDISDFSNAVQTVVGGMSNIGGAWQFVSASTASGASSVDFTGLESGYDYAVAISDGRTSSGYYIALCFGTTGPTWQSSDYRYASVKADSSQNGGPIGTYGFTHIPLYNGSTNATAAGEGATCEILIPDPVAVAKHQIQAHSVYFDTSSAALGIQATTGRRDVAESVTALRFYAGQGAGTVSGTFILYRRKRSA